MSAFMSFGVRLTEVSLRVQVRATTDVAVVVLCNNSLFHEVEAVQSWACSPCYCEIAADCERDRMCAKSSTLGLTGPAVPG